MKSLKFFILEDTFVVHQLKPGASIPKQVFSSSFYAIAKSENELSIVGPAGVTLESERSEPGWSALRVDGTLDFGETGILAGISTTLAKAGISIFAISTFDTDYILVKSNQLKEAKAALSAAGHKFGRAKKQEPAPSTSWAVSTYREVLEKQIPAIRALLLDKIGPATLSTLRDKGALGIAVGSAYEFLPTAIRIVIPRQVFIDFVVENLDRILPKTPATSPKAPTGKSAKETRPRGNSKNNP